jgi:pyruvate/2-oxoglutarate/acetoin dehydrogenase E1 component
MISYAKSIQLAFERTLKKDSSVFVIGQGLWSPWYVGSTMVKLQKKFGENRVLDSPVSENATTGLAFGASINGLKPVVVHPRMDFMVLAMDQITNQISKWSHMLGGKTKSYLTIRAIINRGGEQGAQHSQSLQSWLVHIPGLVVVMPSNPQDAYDMLISSILSPVPVIYIDDRWLYDLKQNVNLKNKFRNILKFKPKRISKGKDVTIVGISYGTKIAIDLNKEIKKLNKTADIFDLRILNPFKIDEIIKSVKKTKKLVVIDFSWKNCSISSEVIATVAEKNFHFKSLRINLKNTPAPSSKKLEEFFYPNSKDIYLKIKNFIK